MAEGAAVLSSSELKSNADTAPLLFIERLLVVCRCQSEPRVHQSYSIRLCSCDDVGQRGRQVKATGPFRNRQHADTAANEDMRVIHITDKVHRTTPPASCLDVPNGLAIAITSYDLHSVAVWIPSWGLSSLVWH